MKVIRERRSLSLIAIQSIGELIVVKATKNLYPYTIILGILDDVKQPMLGTAIWDEKSRKMYSKKTSIYPMVRWKLIKENKRINSILKRFGYKGIFLYWDDDKPSYLDGQIINPIRKYNVKEIALVDCEEASMQTIYPEIKPRIKYSKIANYT